MLGGKRSGSPSLAMNKQAGRNDPCPCGSGKKFKRCHGRPQRGAPVLYIHPAKQAVDFVGAPLGRPYGLIPVGVAALVNELRANGIDVQGVNYPLEKGLNPAFDLRKWLQGTCARVALIDLHWYEHAYGAISVARTCKEVLPHIRTVLGGLTASAFAGDILTGFSEVDAIIRGDAERPLLGLVKELLRVEPGRASPSLSDLDVPNLSYRDGSGVVENALAYCAATVDLDALDFVDLSFLEHHEEYSAHEYIVTDLELARRALATTPFRGRWLCNARGCRYECSYCGGCRGAHQALAGRDGIVTRSPARMVDDLMRLERSGFVQAAMSFDLAELGDAYWQELFSLMRGNGVTIGLYNELFQLPGPEFIQEFVRTVDMTHSSLALSPLSGCEHVRRLNGKRFSNDELFDTLDLLGRHNVPILVYFSLNLPGENEQSLQDTLNLAGRIYDFYPPSLLKILNSCHTLDPLSPMSLYPEKYAVEVGMRTFRDYYAYCRDTQLATPESRTEMHRGFRPVEAHARALSEMADTWDAARQGMESSWWPIPPSW